MDKYMKKNGTKIMCFLFRRQIQIDVIILRIRFERRIFVRLTSYLQEGRLTVVLTGEIDHHCAKNYICSIEAKLEAYNPMVCVLDFSEVTFMDSSGIAVVINAMRAMSRLKGQLIVSGLKDQPMKVMRASGIHKLVEVKEAVL
jgi:stage II sporulation protein AA (anti-sigma F factor antagonist)